MGVGTHVSESVPTKPRVPGERSSNIDPTTEIASDFRVARYREIRPTLDTARPGTSEWSETIGAFRRRVEERFLHPISHLAGSRRSQERSVPGFAMLALDCLLIDTLQSFREGRVSTGEVSPASSFRTFLKSPRFPDFNSGDRAAFFDYVRNALLHNGETRGDWRVRADGSRMLSKAGETRIINRNLFHGAIVEEFEDYCTELVSGPEECRQKFLRRMDAICGVSLPPTTLYFAYGSNLGASEIAQTAPQAHAEGVAFLPGFRLVFTKHSQKWGGDAASIEESPTSVVWGYVYRLNPEERAALVAREGGYDERVLTVWRVDGTPDCQDGKPVNAIAFVGGAKCGSSCGPAQMYRDLVVEGARSRGLPTSYIDLLAEAPPLKTEPMTPTTSKPPPSDSRTHDAER